MNYEKNIKILTDFEKGLQVLGNGQPVNFKIKGSDGELKKVSKEEFARWMTEGKEEENFKVPPKESLVYGASGDIDGITVFRERKGKDGVIRESYYQPRSEEEKKRIIERNKKRRGEVVNYNNWTKNQLISEINKLKTEIENLKTNPTLTSSEKQTKIQQNQQQLEKLNNYYSNSVSQLNNNSSSKSNLPTNLAIGGTVLAIVGLVALLVIRKTAKIKK